MTITQAVHRLPIHDLYGVVAVLLEQETGTERLDRWYRALLCLLGRECLERNGEHVDADDEELLTGILRATIALTDDELNILTASLVLSADSFPNTPLGVFFERLLDLTCHFWLERSPLAA